MYCSVVRKLKRTHRTFRATGTKIPCGRCFKLLNVGASKSPVIRWAGHVARVLQN
jgi:hypothetical protein